MDYSKYQSAPKDSLLARINENAQEAVRLATAARVMIKDLLEMKAKFKRLTEEVLPTLLEEAAVGGQAITEFTVGDQKIKLDTLITGHCPAPTTTEPEDQKRRSKIFQWMDEHGFGKLIEREFRIKLGRGDVEEGKKVQSFIQSNNLAGGSHFSVHHARFNKFVKECLEEGVDLPEYFNVRDIKVVKLPGIRVPWSKIQGSADESED